MRRRFWIGTWPCGYIGGVAAVVAPNEKAAREKLTQAAVTATKHQDIRSHEDGMIVQEVKDATVLSIGDY
jgi:hypothetical protein